MTLSDTARRILSAAATHMLGLAAPPAALPAAARDAVRRSLLKQGLVAECAAPAEQIGLGWRLRTTGPRPPRQGTKQAAVLTLLRRPDGATVAQVAEATGWANHTVRGFFTGLKKRQGITVEVLERVRQVGPNKQGAKSSYSVYRLAEAR